MEIGDVVVETEGFFKGSEFTLIAENRGSHPKWGERNLIAPVEPKKPVLSPDASQFLLLSKERPDLLESLQRAFQQDADNAIRWSCGTGHDAHLKEADNLAVLAGITQEHALECMDFEDCPASHGLKPYVLLSNKSIDPETIAALALYFSVGLHGKNSKQINSRATTEWLIKSLGVLPTRKQKGK